MLRFVHQLSCRAHTIRHRISPRPRGSFVLCLVECTQCVDGSVAKVFRNLLHTLGNSGIPLSLVNCIDLRVFWYAATATATIKAHPSTRASLRHNYQATLVAHVVLCAPKGAATHAHAIFLDFLKTKMFTQCPCPRYARGCRSTARSSAEQLAARRQPRRTALPVGGWRSDE